MQDGYGSSGNRYVGGDPRGDTPDRRGSWSDARVYVCVPSKFCNMLLFRLSEYLRGLAYPSAIVVALTDIDNPQEKLAGYLESRIFPGHASALESRPSFLGIKFVSRSSAADEISRAIEDCDFATSPSSCFLRINFALDTPSKEESRPMFEEIPKRLSQRST
ncbi:hypothetical protein KM043_005076 [Ampulex compressa]|nr:hypothetical protein KM043_005076 [Ampulex compressa]